MASCYRRLVRTICHGHSIPIDHIATVILLCTEDGPLVLSVGLESQVVIVCDRGCVAVRLSDIAHATALVGMYAC